MAQSILSKLLMGNDVRGQTGMMARGKPIYPGGAPNNGKQIGGVSKAAIKRRMSKRVM